MKNAFSNLVHRRWSPRAFTPEVLPRQLVRELFDLVQWAHSSNNEQPWRYWIEEKNQSQERLLLESFLAPGNAFAKEAGILGLAVAKKTFTRDGTFNRCAEHDLGSGSQILSLAVEDRGYSIRWMAGFDTTAAERAIPEDFVPVSMFALGVKSPSAHPLADRGRKPREGYLFSGGWGKSF